MNGNPICQNSMAYDLGGVPRPPGQTVADALAGLDHVQNTPDQWGLGAAHELAALRDLADAVRAQPAAPLVGVTEHDGYTVRAVITTAGRTSAWFVAAEHPSGKWATWRAEQGDGGTLGFSQRQLFAKRAGLTAEDITRDLRGEPEVFRYGRERNRRAALADLAERAQIAL